MAKRFNNLDAALKYLRPISTGVDGIVPDAPANTPLAKYQQYKAGKLDVDYPRAAASLPGSLEIITLKPFAFAAADTKEYRVDFSDRAQGQLATFGLTAAELGIDSVLADTDLDSDDYKPAKAVCRNITATTSTTKTSKLTGLPYKTKADASYTLPFGRTTANPSYAEQKAAIIAAVDGAAGNKSVSFKSERF